LRLNLARKAARVRVFEAGRVFMRDDRVADGEASVRGVAQPTRLAALVYGPADAPQWGLKDRNADFFDLKGDVESLLAPRAARFIAATHPAMHPGRCARIETDGVPIGFIGELHPKWRLAYELPSAPMLFEVEASALVKCDLPAYVPIQRQQSVWRDISVVADERVTHDALTQAIATARHAELIRSTRLFDIYKPTSASGDMRAGERSLSLRLELLDDEVTLTDDRIDAVVNDVLDALADKLGVRLRS
jgi:phenylalanyl-tRNA synthetase beta chain